ncbi:hypothetical protein [Streptomyces griseofuscus]|uniref:hypothetical protein n=1 Tax=Streptomyces griseofuscus TaxID=146922 RepID=UPI00155ABE80|nr:hypothetical protein [Streptomyces griseofuscus]
MRPKREPCASVTPDLSDVPDSGDASPPAAAAATAGREGVYGQCLGGGGWILGHTIDALEVVLGGEQHELAVPTA